MKYRLGFVTNSSSTSYIIALKNNVNFDENKIEEIARLACDNYFKENYDETEEIDESTYKCALEDVIDKLNITLQYGKDFDEWKISGFGGYELDDYGEWVASYYLPQTDEVKSFSWGG